MMFNSYMQCEGSKYKYVKLADSRGFHREDHTTIEMPNWMQYAYFTIEQFLSFLTVLPMIMSTTISCK